MKRFSIFLAIGGALASGLLLLFSPLSMELDKRIPIAIAIIDALLLVVLAVINRRIGKLGGLAFAGVGLLLVCSSLFVVKHHWRPSQTAPVLKDLEQIRNREKKSP